MNKKLNTVLLIDDDEDINFINKLVIEDIVNTIQIEAVQSVEQAIAFLSSNKTPDLIFLDINMPLENGWDFIESYKMLPIQKEDCLIIMLTSSINIDDKEKALSIKEINDFMGKPLTNKVAQEILSKHFNLL